MEEPRFTLDETPTQGPREALVVPLDNQVQRRYLVHGIEGGQIRSFKYRYLAENGMVFTTGAIDLDHARRLRDDWLEKHGIRKET